ncbi:MarR family transcriptional regulator [Pseudonocardia broussonetiae]|uniref:MarR family transcriptional regulator n=1 Tax=Pseudonocardia broussonetiae TaxID=2736640 RepID=A0A6M6JFH6_9PSEU|nr:MarR family transcriptional regulator [Pseudonocardia broussonetiae]
MHPVPDALAAGLLLPRAGQAVDRLLRRAVAAHGLTPTSLGVLGVLARGRPASHRDLAAALGIAPATLTPAVDALERGGLVRRVRDTVDRRVVQVRATDAGLTRYAGAVDAAARELGERVPTPPGAVADAVRDYLLAVVAAAEGAAVPGQALPGAATRVDGAGAEGAAVVAARGASADPDDGPAPAPVAQVEAGGQRADPSVELDGHRDLGGVGARVAEPDPAEPGR